MELGASLRIMLFFVGVSDEGLVGVLLGTAGPLIRVVGEPIDGE